MNIVVDMQIRAAWQLDSKSSLIVVDPTSPNILQFRSGAEVNRLLSRPFFVELQSRYGNMFFVREEVCNDTLRFINTICMLLWISGPCLIFYQFDLQLCCQSEVVESPHTNCYVCKVPSHKVICQ